jgi:hypothetical protein
MQVTTSSSGSLGLFRRVRRVAFVVPLLGVTFGGGMALGTIYASKIRAIAISARERLHLFPDPPHVVRTGQDVDREIELVIRGNETRKQWLQEQMRLNRFAYHRLRLQDYDGNSSDCLQLVRENWANERELAKVTTSNEMARRLAARLAEELPRMRSTNVSAGETSLNEATRWLAQNGSLESRPSVSNEQWRMNESSDHYMGVPE